MNHPLLYVLHSGQLFGTERMALATLQRIQPTEGIVLAPPGPVHAAARARGLQTIVAASRGQMLAALIRYRVCHRHVDVITTGVVEALAARWAQILTRGRGKNLHVVHGGTSERLSYGRKRWLLPLQIRLVAVSSFVRDRLVVHGVPAERVTVIHNFLADPELPAPPATGAEHGLRRVVMLSRLDGVKRVGLLLDALACTPGLDSLRFDIYGSGEQEGSLRERAWRWPQVHFHGFVADAARNLDQADLLLHTCPEEPFGLALLEAFAAGVPVLAPNSGGAAEVVRHGIEGWHFAANDPVALGRALLHLSSLPRSRLDDRIAAGRRALAERFGAEAQAARYASLLGASA